MGGDGGCVAPFRTSAHTFRCNKARLNKVKAHQKAVLLRFLVRAKGEEHSATTGQGFVKDFMERAFSSNRSPQEGGVRDRSTLDSTNNGGSNGYFCTNGVDFVTSVDYPNVLLVLTSLLVTHSLRPRRRVASWWV